MKNTTHVPTNKYIDLIADLRSHDVGFYLICNMIDASPTNVSEWKNGHKPGEKIEAFFSNPFIYKLLAGYIESATSLEGRFNIKATNTLDQGIMLYGTDYLGFYLERLSLIKQLVSHVETVKSGNVLPDLKIGG